MRFDRFTKTLVPASLGLAVLFALTASVAAQAAETKPAAKPAASSTQDKPATASTSADSNSIAVTGLTKENSAAAKTALEGLSTSMWRCSACNMTSATKGTCEMCKKELVSEKSASLRNVVIDPDKGTIGFALAPGQSVKLSELEAALVTNHVSIPRDKLTISPSSTLMISGVGTEDAVKKLETELKNAKIFDTVSCRLADNKQGEVKVHCTSPASRTKVDEALAKAGPDFKLVDIVWTSPSATAHSKG